MGQKSIDHLVFTVEVKEWRLDAVLKRWEEKGKGESPL
jgi:hypothetical protein